MPTIGDILRTMESQLLIGRERELNTFRQWLTAEIARPEILNVTGHGGLGKSSLLRAFARIAQDVGRPSILLDGRDFPHTPEGFLDALGSPSQVVTLAYLNETRPLILLDTFEELGEINRYLQEEFLPRLDTSVKVVIAGRYPLGLMWTSDSRWNTIVRPMPLQAFCAEESRAYLQLRGIEDLELIEQVVGAIGGNPLAISLASDMVLQFGIRNFDNVADWHLILRRLLEQLLREVHDPELRELLEACAMVRQFDETMLAFISDRGDISGPFNKLCQLSFLRATNYGLMLHDDIRKVLTEDLRWRRPDRFDTLRLRALAYYKEKTRSASLPEQERLLVDRVFLLENTVIQDTMFRGGESGQVWIEPGKQEDYDGIRRVWSFAREHFFSPKLGYECQPERDWEFLEAILQNEATRLRVARYQDGQVIGFSTALPVSKATIDVLEIHPMIAPLIHTLWTPEELDDLPATPESSNIFYLVHLGFSDFNADAVRQMLMRDHVGLFALGGLFLVTAPDPTAKAALRACGFQWIQEARNWVYGKNHPCDGFVLDLRNVGVERWIEALTVGQQPAPELDKHKLEQELQAVLQNWKDDAFLAKSPLMQLPIMQREERDPTSLREAILRCLVRIKGRAAAPQRDSYRALELAYLKKATDVETSAKKLSVSRATFYRLAKRGIQELADELCRR